MSIQGFNDFEDVAKLLKDFLQKLEIDKNVKLNSELKSTREKLYMVFKDGSYKNFIEKNYGSISGYSGYSGYSDDESKDVDDYAKPGDADELDTEFNKDDESVENLDSHAQHKDKDET